MLIETRGEPQIAVARVVLGVLAVSHALIGVGSLGLPFIPLPGVWTAVFLVAAGAAAWATLSFTPRAVEIAGAVTPVAYVSRGVALFYSVFDGRATVGWQGSVVGYAVWGTLAVLSFTLFVRGIAPLARLHARRVRTG